MKLTSTNALDEKNHTCMSTVNKTVLSLERFLPYRLSVVSNRISKALAQTYQEKFGLTRPQWRVLAVLGEHGVLTANQITDYTAMDKVAVSRAVNALVSEKLIKQKGDKTDKRKTVLSLTAGGKRTYQAVIPLAQAYENQLLSTLTESEQAALNRVLTKLDAADLSPSH